MARLKPIDLLRSCRSESSLISFVNNLSGQYSAYEYRAHGHGYDYNYDNANEDVIGDADNVEDIIGDAGNANGERNVAGNEDVIGDADNANEDINGDADNANGKSDMKLRFSTLGDMVDSYIPLARRMAASQSLNGDGPESSSSSRSLAGTATVHDLYLFTHYIVFWRNGFTVNDGPLRDLDNPESDYFFQGLRLNYLPVDLVPFPGGYVEFRCILRNENHPADRERLNTAIEVDETRPTTSLQLWFSDQTREVVRFNLHDTVADIRAYFDASRPEENGLYYLLSVLPPRCYRELYNPDETIQQADLGNSIIEQRRY